MHKNERSKCAKIAGKIEGLCIAASANVGGSPVRRSAGSEMRPPPTDGLTNATGKETI